MVNDYLNPYDKDVTEANVNILVHSYTSGFYSTTGYIAGVEKFMAELEDAALSALWEKVRREE